MANIDTWVIEVDVKSLIALMGNEVGVLYLHPRCHGNGAGRVLVDKAQKLYGDLEVEVFKENSIRRKFYSQYGFELLEKKEHEPTGQKILRVKFHG